MSLNKKILVELSPYSLQIAVLAGDRLAACRDFTPESKDAVTAFLAEHSGAPVALALLTPKNQFGRLSSDEEASSIRNTSRLLALAAKIGHTFGSSASAVAFDAATGLAPDEGQTSHWVLDGTTSSSIDEANAQLAALGLSPQHTTFALPAQLGAAVSALKSTPDVRIALWQLNEADSSLWLVSAAGVEKSHLLPIGFNHIFDAVQAELGLKFRTAAAKLFLNNAYEFGDLAGNIAGRLRDELLKGLAALGTKPAALGLLGLPVHQAWFARGVAKAVDLPVWSPDVAAICGQLGLAGEAINNQLPHCSLGLLKAAAAAGKTGIAWIPAMLGQQPAAAAAVPATPVSAASALPAASSPPAQPVPVAVAPPVSVAAAVPTAGVAQPARTLPEPFQVQSHAPASNQPSSKKSPLVMIAVGGLVVAGLAIAGVAMVLKNKPADQPPIGSKLPSGNGQSPTSTVAYYRFEQGSNDQPIGARSNGIVSDKAPIGGDLRVFGGRPTYSIDVPSANIDGQRNDFSIHHRQGDNIENVSAGDLNSIVFNDFTVEVFAKLDDLTGWQTFVGRNAGSMSDTLDNLGLFYLQKTPEVPQIGRTDMRTDTIVNYFRVALITPEFKTCQVLSPFVAEANTWYHLAVVGDKQKGTLALYVNGVLTGESPDYTGLMTPQSFSPWTFGHGQFAGRPVDALHGFLDEIRISRVALKPEEFLNASSRK